MQGMDRTHITKSALLERAGWTATLVSRLLGEPDQRKKVHGITNPLSLYAVTRIEQAEATADFAQSQEGIAKRKIAAAKAVSTKTANLMAAIEAMPVEVKQLRFVDVKRLAIDSYNMRSRGDSFATNVDDPAFLDRITVNFIRHELSKYDTALWEVAGKTGVAHAVVKIRRRVYSAIAQAYPALSAECERQIEARQ
jgi:hypothetical protein